MNEEEEFNKLEALKNIPGLAFQGLQQFGEGLDWTNDQVNLRNALRMNPAHQIGSKITGKDAFSEENTPDWLDNILDYSYKDARDDISGGAGWAAEKLTGSKEVGQGVIAKLGSAGATADRFMKGTTVAGDITKAAVHLGTASAVSEFWEGPSAMFDSFVHGAIAGGAFGTIGNYQNLLKKAADWANINAFTELSDSQQVRVLHKIPKYLTIKCDISLISSIIRGKCHYISKICSSKNTKKPVNRYNMNK